MRSAHTRTWPWRGGGGEKIWFKKMRLFKETIWRGKAGIWLNSQFACPHSDYYSETYICGNQTAMICAFKTTTTTTTKTKGAVPPCDQTTAVALWSCESQTPSSSHCVDTVGAGQREGGNLSIPPPPPLSLSPCPSLSLPLPLPHSHLSPSVFVCCQWLVSRAVVLYILNQVTASGAREERGCSHTEWDRKSFKAKREWRGKRESESERRRERERGGGGGEGMHECAT